jgi:hypothetical protein
MTANDSTSGTEESATGEQASNRWTYSAQGTANVVGEHFGGTLEKGPAEVIVQPVIDGDVPVSLVRGDPVGCDPSVEVFARLSPERARSLAVDLFEQAAGAERDREASEPDA